MDQIATAADVARGTLYNHFALKEAVLARSLHAQLREGLTSLLAAVRRRRSFHARAVVVLDASAAWWVAHRRYLAPYVRYRFQAVGTATGDKQAHSSASDLASAWEQLVAQAQADGQLRGDMTADKLAMYLHFLYLSALMRWLDDDGLVLADECMEALRLFEDGASVPA